MNKRILIPLLCMMLAFAGCAPSVNVYAAKKTTTTKKKKATKKKKKSTKKVLYNDSTLKATFTGISENAGFIIINVKLQNKSDDEITVLPMDSSVNDTMVMYTSGTLATIQGHKTLNQRWTFKQDTVSISKPSQVKTLDFKLQFGDTKTDNIHVKVKK
ncbi:MAG: hypothetical protein DUD30_04545 [Lactobacillus sp.]|nr:MAG: hypothetical protein DUD30_04545 [Lactobacillus sp.]